MKKFNDLLANAYKYLSSRSFRWCLSAAFVIFVSACGGGTTTTTTTTTVTTPPPTTPTSTGMQAQMTASSSAVVLTDSQASNLQVGSEIGADGVMVTTVTLFSDPTLNASLQSGKTLIVSPSAKLPFGLTGKVSKITPNTGAGTVTASIEPATLRDAFSKFSVNESAVRLSTDNFVGAIAPLAISGGDTTPKVTQVGLLNQANQLTLFNGALVLNSGDKSGVQAGLDISQSDLNLGEISLKTEVKLKDFAEPSDISNWQSSSDAKVAFSIKVSDLTLVQKAEFEDVASVPYALKSINYRVKGSVTGDVKIVGNISGDVGYYSKAWHESEVQAVKILGISGKMLGLEAKDKVGKIPLVGLVFSAKCPSLCPVATGQNQTPIRNASAGGIIVWVYMNAKGQISFDGSLGARVNTGFELGVHQPEDGSLDSIQNLSKATPDKNFMEVPFFDGEVKSQVNLGVSLDADVFFGGVRFLNIALDGGTQANLNTKGQGVYAWPDRQQQWEWQGNTCMTASLGAGLVTNLRLGIGGEVKTNWKKIDDKLTGRLPYEVQLPKESDRATPGWQEVFGLPVWYTGLGESICLPKPEIDNSSLAFSGSIYNWSVAGKNLPDDLELSVSTTGVCLTKPQLTINASDGGNKASFACSGKSGFTNVSGVFSSKKATNLGGKTAWEWTLSNPLQPTPSNGVCGASHLAVVPVAPTGNLCSIGAASLVSGIGPWNWTCSGVNGGAGASCSANKSSELPSVTGASPLNLTRNVPTTVTVTGFSLPVGTAFAISGVVCNGDYLRSSVAVSQTCTAQTGSLNTEYLTVKSAPLIGSNLMAAGQVISFQIMDLPAVRQSALADTGIGANQCYAAGSDVLVNCTSAAAIALNSRQDGMVGRDVVSPNSADGHLGFSYSIVGSYSKEECVKDNITGLTWEGKPTTGLRATGNLYTHYDSASKTQIVTDNGVYSNPTQAQIYAGTNSMGYVAAINDANLCGYSDWRLPTPDELQGLVVYGLNSSRPTIDSTWFPNTQQQHYWTSTEYSKNSSDAWFVHFGNGAVDSRSRSSLSHIRLVR